MKRHLMLALHNLLAHPVMEIMFWLSLCGRIGFLNGFGRWLHDVTVPAQADKTPVEPGPEGDVWECLGTAGEKGTRYRVTLNGTEVADFTMETLTGFGIPQGGPVWVSTRNTRWVIRAEIVKGKMVVHAVYYPSLAKAFEIKVSEPKGVEALRYVGP